MNKLSVAIITLNEEENIGRCIDSIREIADEIIVVDSFSTDRTSEIVRSKKAQIIERKFTNYIDQKNFAIGACNFDYVLNLDADECLSKELEQSIAIEKSKDFKDDGYSMSRLNFYCGRPIKTSGWYPNRKIRLWNKQKGKWEGQLVHENLVMDKNSSIKHLRGDLLHYSFPTHGAFVQQSNKFARLAARQLQAKPTLLLFCKMLFSPPFKFLKNYLFRWGFADGYTGFIICYYQGREVFLKYFMAIKYKLS